MTDTTQPEAPSLANEFRPTMHIDVLISWGHDAVAELRRLQAENEALRADAERYRWLRDNHDSAWAICEWADDPDGLGYYRDARQHHIVDAAIDAAKAGQ